MTSNCQDPREADHPTDALPAVSVIMATHAGNPLPFLQAAMDSVLAQTWRNFELLIAMDGPIPDDIRHFLDASAQQDDRVHLLPLPENRGPGAARNAAIRVAQGQYIAVLDGDDLAESNRLERQLAFIRETQADLIGSFYRRIDSQGRLLSIRRLPLSTRAIARAMALINPIGSSTVLARADLMKAHPYPENQRFAEDYACWVELARGGYQLRNQPEFLTAFRADGSFLNRRRGWSVFIADWRVKRRAATLWGPAYPLALLIATLAASTRLLPASWLALAYRVRNALPR